MLSSMATYFVLLITTHAAVLEVPTAYPTIQAAIDVAQNGDTVRVRAGTYDEALSFKRPITLEGEGKDLVVVRRPATEGAVLSIEGCGDSAVRGMAFEHTGRPAKDDANGKPAAIVEIADSSVEMFDCEVRNGGGSGIRIAGKSVCKVLSCSAANNLRAGFAASGPGASVTFVGNTAQGNALGIAFLDGGSGSARINRCFENSTAGIAIQGNGEPLLFGNTCFRNGAGGISCEANSTMTALGNRCVENKGWGITVGANSVVAARFNRIERNRRNAIWEESNVTLRQKGNVCLDNGEIGESEARCLFKEKRYAEIETIAARLRKDKAKTYYGEWQMKNVYQGMIGDCRNMSKTDERSFLIQVREWKEAFPNSITCAITEADAYCRFAWRERGNGWASTVTEQGWKGFRSYLNKALEVVEAAEKLPERDPHLFVVKCTIMRGLGKTSSDTPPILLVLGWWTNTSVSLPDPAEQAFLQGIAIEPTYYPLYYAHVQGLLPRWGGSPADMVRFAEWSAQRTAETEGDSLYARIANETLHDDGRDNYLRDYRFSWPRIRQGFRDILTRYPESESWLNAYCYMACLYGDRDLANELFGQIGDKWHSYAWNSEAHFRQWKAWAANEASNPSQNLLESAVRSGDISEIERLLRAGGSPNAVTEDGKSLLTYAIRARKMDVTEILLANGADVNFVPPNGIAPISIASWDHYSDSYLKLLINNNANPNVTPPDGWSPLLYSIGQSLKPRVPYLLEHGANPNDEVNGQSALFHAIYRNDMDSVRALVEKGADVNRHDSRDRTPLQWAEHWKKTEIAAYLREHGAQ